MTVISHRDGRRRHARTGRVRAGLAAAGVAALVPLAACGTNAQTLRPYTPAEGVNFDVGNVADPSSVIHVRNLLIISRAEGSGFVSASLSTSGTDSLVGVTGIPYLAGGGQAGQFSAQIPGQRVLLTGNALTVLTESSPFVTIGNAPGLKAGLDADVTVTFAKAGSYTARTPVVDGNLPPYTDVTPSASPEASESPTITAAPSPTP